MRVFERIHGQYTYGRRVRRLCDHLAEILPPDARVLDVGCGDGQLAHLIKEKRPDIEIKGVDILVRCQTQIPVAPFDGKVIPYQDASFDVVLFSDVLHHTEDPLVLLREAARVASKSIVLKDHTCDGLLARRTLRFMDQVGNARHGVALPYNYWPRQKWLKAFESLGLSISAWKEDLKLYPAWADLIFGRSLHFVGRLDVP